MICLVWSKIVAYPFSGASSIQAGPLPPHKVSCPSVGPHGPLLTHLTMFSGCLSHPHLRMFLGGRQGARCALAFVRLFETPWAIQSRNSPGQNTGMGSLSLHQAIFPTQGLNPGLPHCRPIFTS